MRAQRGFTYVAMLFALAIFGIGLAALGESWSAASRREREEELIRIGTAYARAIGEYHRRSPGARKAYPARLEELVEDKRFVGTVRHLRRLYRDPVTNGAEWGLVRAADGGIMGVFSLSDKNALRTQPIVLPGAETATGARYSDWKFVYKERAPG
ncbi:MAG TPA: type II secretion system protein [Paucimonas sp.]|nr:type II secretion system protein [Paucimonas sp.]